MRNWEPRHQETKMKGIPLELSESKECSQLWTPQDCNANKKNPVGTSTCAKGHTEGHSANVNALYRKMKPLISDPCNDFSVGRSRCVRPGIPDCLKYIATKSFSQSGVAQQLLKPPELKPMADPGWLCSCNGCDIWGGGWQVWRELDSLAGGARGRLLQEQCDAAVSCSHELSIHVRCCRSWPRALTLSIAGREEAWGWPHHPCC